MRSTLFSHVAGQVSQRFGHPHSQIPSFLGIPPVLYYMPFPLALQDFLGGEGGIVTPSLVISDGPSGRCKRPL